MKIAVFDIDGTLANNAHRQKHINKKNNHLFHIESIHDDSFEEIVFLARQYFKKIGYKVILVTGRPKTYRAITMKWLDKNHIKYDNLYMSTPGDGRSDQKFKKDVLEEITSQGDEVVIAFEDRQKVVDMWRANVVLCMQCDYGNF